MFNIFLLTSIDYLLYYTDRRTPYPKSIIKEKDELS